VFLPHDFAKAYRGLLDAVKKGEISEERIDESLYRIAKAKLRYVVQ
jgi:beta-N-acetylhexosaminidase